MQQLDLFGTVETKKPENKTPVQEKPLRTVTELTGKTATVQAPEVSKTELSKPAPNTTVADPPESFSGNRTIPATAIKEEVKQTIKENKRGRKSYKEMEAEMVLIEVPDDDTLFLKQYYSISEVAQWFHVNASLIRYWENEFDILKPRKTRKGDRLFRPEDVKNIHLIYYLLRQRKFSIEGAKQFMKENKKKADAQMQLVQSLTKFRSFLLEWKAILGA